jgi:hypothetical protein
LWNHEITWKVIPVIVAISGILATTLLSIKDAHHEKTIKTLQDWIVNMSASSTRSTPPH